MRCDMSVSVHVCSRRAMHGGRAQSAQGFAHEEARVGVAAWACACVAARLKKNETQAAAIIFLHGSGAGLILPD